MIAHALEWLAAELPRYSIGKGSDVYLDRYDLLDTPWFAVVLHCFRRGDADPELHNHPWRWALSMVLSGGYSEERVIRGSVYRRTVRPGRLNLIWADTYHRVDLLEGECWTLFVTGSKSQSWGFKDRWTGRVTPWREFVAAREARP